MNIEQQIRHKLKQITQRLHKMQTLKQLLY